ncbi:MAG TPA: DUF4912 domain-containing protein [Anaeromyxobacteraceae bacterium]|nr:DUF4912 domain-containing protein [Anaeromyxobacteraceae bacterium]
MATKKPTRKAPAKPAAAKAKAAAKPAPKAAKAATKAAPARAAAAKAAPSRAAAPKGRAGAKPAPKAAPKAPAKAAPKARASAPARPASPRRKPAPRPPAVEGLDPDGFFVARVLGEDAARRAPHPMTEGEEREDPMALRALADVPVLPDDEELGELPWSYGDDVFVGLPRDPRTLFFYWDHSEETRRKAFEWMDGPRAQLRVHALGPGLAWELVRTVDFALESRGFYVHDLDPGRTYRGEIVVVSRDGRERVLGEPSNEVALPSSGPSPVVDDRFATVPWDLPLDGWLREARAGGSFPEEIRTLLARLSRGARPAAPAWEVREERAEPERPTSPTRAWGGGKPPGGGRGKGGRKADR